MVLEDKIGGKTPSITLSQLRILLEVVFLSRTFEAEDAVKLVKWIQDKNHFPCSHLSAEGSIDGQKSNL
jgi:hypothetical protein